MSEWAAIVRVCFYAVDEKAAEDKMHEVMQKFDQRSLQYWTIDELWLTDQLTEKEKP